MKEIKPGYKETPIGILPRDWEVKKFSECFSYGKTDSHSREKMTENNEEKSEILNIHYGDIHTKYGIHLDIAKNLNIIPALKGDVVVSKNIEYLKDGDLIIADASEDYKDIGKSIEIKNIGLNKVIGGLHTILARGNEFTVKNYRGYILKNNQVKKQIDRVATGISVLGLSKTNLDNILIPIPPKEEQEKIAQILMTWDEVIEKQEELIEQEKEFKKGMMQKIFNQELRFKDENGNDYPEWEEKKFKDISKINQGLQISISERYSENAENRYFYITNEFLKKNSDKKYYIENPSKSVLCNQNDILMTRTGNTGQVVTGVSGAFHNNFFKINYDKKVIDKNFLCYILTSNKIQNTIMKLAGASTIPDLNHGDFYKIKSYYPSLPEQKKIADFLSTIDEKIEVLEKKLEELKEQKKGLIQKLLTGDVRVKS